MEAPPSFQIDLDLRKRQEKTILQINETDLETNQDKILEIIKKECVDLQTWFYITVSRIYILIN
jgi:hypothetical protein